MTAKSNLKQAREIMDERKKELAEKSLDKDPKKAGLERSMRDIAKLAKEEGIE